MFRKNFLPVAFALTCVASLVNLSFAQPDLVADRVYLRTAPNGGVEASNPVAGQQYYFHADWRNLGASSGGGFYIEFRRNGAPDCAVNIGSVSGNASVITACPTPITWAANDKALSVVLDVLNSLSEPVENNNFASRFFNYARYGDFDLTVQARSPENFSANSGADFCFVYGFQDESHYYYVMFNHSANDTRVFKIKGSARTEIGNLGAFIIPDNNFHEVRLRRSGSQLEVFFDNTLLGAGNDAEYGEGGMGPGSFNDMASFDDFCIKALNASTCLFSDNFETGSAQNWIPLNPSRWSIVSDGGDLAYALNTSSYSNLDPLRLGEYSLVAVPELFSEVVSLSGRNPAGWGDYDNDGDLDFFLTPTVNNDSYPALYRNDAGQFVIAATLTIGGIAFGEGWNDYDNDGDLDFLELLLEPFFPSGLLMYQNRGGNFGTSSIGLPRTGYSNGTWGDYDNDGDMDLTSNFKIYRNDRGQLSSAVDLQPGLSSGQAVWGDYDNDGDLDLAATGIAQFPARATKIYRNDNGSFTDIAAGLAAIGGAGVWGDYDNDGDLDLLLNAAATAAGALKLYRNENGVFSEVATALPQISGETAWGDYDNDGDLDVLLSGGATPSDPTTKVYRNDAGNFLELDDFGLAMSGSAKWGDYDNDGDLDILFAGTDATGVNKSAKVYRNNMRVANALPSTPNGLAALVQGSAAQLRWNKAADNQTPQNSLTYNLRLGTTPGGVEKKSPLANVATGFVLKPELLGNTNHANHWTIKNLPNGTYYWSVQSVDQALAGSAFSAEQSFVVNVSIAPPQNLQAAAGFKKVSLAWDANTEGNLLRYRIYRHTSSPATVLFDSVAAGTTTYLDRNVVNQTTYFYHITAVNQSGNESGYATEASATPTQFANVLSTSPTAEGSAAWGDYDNDNDLDVLITGYQKTGDPYGTPRPFTDLLRNEGSGFVGSGINLQQVLGSDVAWGDYDNDGDLDILLSGTTAYHGGTSVTKIYRNDVAQGGSFSDIQAALTAVSYGDGAWGDYDNDGDLDFVLTGFVSNAAVSKIYRNDDGSFVDTQIPLAGVAVGEASWGDYDNDGDLDLLLSGNAIFIYQNDGRGGFQAASAPFSQGQAAWGDYDNDADLDIAITGANGFEVFRNDNGAYQQALDAPATANFVAWGDYENDGDLDLLHGAAIYRNEGGGFVRDTTALALERRATGAWGDYDNDGDLDILFSEVEGRSTFEGRFTENSRIYRNDIETANTPPAAPTNLATAKTDTSATFAWQKAVDNQTAQNGLTYNLRVGTTPGGSEIMSPHSASNLGYRRVVQWGNVNQRTRWTISNLPLGKYYWSVQALDNNFAGSTFAAEQSFTVSSCVSNGDVNNDGSLTPGDALCAFQIYLNNGSLPPSCDAPASDCELIAADVSCEGVTTPGDALAIFQRYLQGLPPAECFAKTALAKAQAATRPYALSLQARVVLASAIGQEPERLRVAVQLDDPAGLAAFGLALSYPSAQLEFLGVARGPLTKEWMQLDAAAAHAGEVLVGGFHIEPLQLTNSGALCEVLFKIKDQNFRIEDLSLRELRDDLRAAAIRNNAGGLGLVPRAFKLYQSFPNPYRASERGNGALLRFDLPEAEPVKVELVIYNLMGQVVRRLVSGERGPGAYEAQWNGKDERGLLVPSGTYWYRITAGKHAASQRMTVVR